VVVDCGGGIRQFLIPADAPGVTITRQNSVDLVKRYARVQFEGVEVEAAAAVGTAEQTPAIIERQRQVALILQCAETIGILDSVLTMTNQWLFDRHSFGRPLASYQALKHRAADMKMWFEAARATTAGAVAAVATRSPEAPKLVSVAKAYVAERAPVTLQDCVQLHGGIGVTWEHDLHLYLRRIALYRAMYGSPEDHHRAVFTLSRKTQPREAEA
jgi:alkylation response protein AidB-like acyl-CoA dehydrogenase